MDDTEIHRQPETIRDIAGETARIGFDMIVVSDVEPPSRWMKSHAPRSAKILDTRYASNCALILSIVAGLQMMRQMLKLTPLAEARRADLARLLTPVFKALVTPAKDR